MSAQTILADFVRSRAIPCPTDDDADAIYFDNGHAREALEAIAAAGYRLLAPGDLDPVTLEKAAEMAEAHAGRTDFDLEPEAAVSESVTAKSIAAASDNVIAIN